jgi:hypothetical protein
MRLMLATIREAYKMLNLPPDWDEDGALPANPVIFNEAMVFIHTMLFHIPDLVPPDISLCKDATIDFSFKNFKNGYELLVNVKEGSMSFYGDNGKNGDRIKSPGIYTQDVVDWCKIHMRKTEQIYIQASKPKRKKNESSYTKTRSDN